jgi:excisionase family DNA binding protein
MHNEILTIREVAELLKINRKTAYRLAAEGKIPGFKVGGSWRFDRQEISNWIRSQMAQQRRRHEAVDN